CCAISFPCASRLLSYSALSSSSRLCILSLSFFFFLLPPPPTSTLFPYTTLFRSSTCPCLGRAACLRDRRVTRLRVLGARLPQATAQLHVVGESQGQQRQQRLSGRISGPR